MLEKLKDAEQRYLSIEEELATPEIFSNQEKYTALMKEYKALTPIIEKFREYKATDKEVSDLKEMLDEPLDAEMRELAMAEYKEAKAKIEPLLDELKILLLPRDPNDDKNVMVEIRSGAGGEEAALFAAVLYRMYKMRFYSLIFRKKIFGLEEQRQERKLIECYNIYQDFPLQGDFTRKKKSKSRKSTY